MKIYVLLFPILCLALGLNAQNEPNWHLLDAEKDGICGTSTYRAHKELLSDKKSEKTIIVAVLDSGVDIEHEDLQGRIWINKDEIPDNGIDDDKNGYIDDVNGWNFLGNAKGEMVDGDNMEFVRMMVALEKKSNLSSEDAALLKTLKKKYTEEQTASAQELEAIQQISSMYENINGLISTHLNKNDFNKADVEGIGTTDDKLALAKKVWLELEAQGLKEEIIIEAKDYYEASVNYHLNKDLNTREVIGDDYTNLKEIGYGNNNVLGGSADHGTHVSGIIAAISGNNLGADGLADNVLIMPVRMVPNGDEHDKDVANGIRYAADNGAHIINMSFGKSYSPYPEAVREAIIYAGEKGVLMVHGSGNDSSDNDKKPGFPRDAVKGEPNLPYWIEVGASDENIGADLLGDFSNYGKKTVDIFAPGVQILSTVPDNKYEKFDGTSMASPVVALSLIHI